MPGEDLVELKFRLFDGTDIGPIGYSSASTIAMLKERIVSEWPRDKKIIPKAANDVKLISAGKILEDNKTVAQCRPPFDELLGGVTIMHVVVQPSLPKAKSGKLQSYSSLQSYGFQISLYKVVCFCLTIYITRVMFLYKLAFQVSCRPSVSLHMMGSKRLRAKEQLSYMSLSDLILLESEPSLDVLHLLKAVLSRLDALQLSEIAEDVVAFVVESPKKIIRLSCT
ncbi:LOW QUALITY PROTEIN: membrane-anchored ubiquitin-fold protein 2-like [Dioscorea cayenensis subsp. rotundata]|uniref:LOW QUALITY PROTEIN: membrane-anchored ubiquitin-fold protein 2-like n=1 Tax=Dioscorea cayennensis subsp. rotundata TaxID=55577 RepID=A0AB40AUW4_DIOCR|nr:LOW QUALITY PROTEIN: membrane-anchored ubiquitin-fold protein 2-like [Dioscorea cayenensis subsp. rotundata]